MTRAAKKSTEALAEAPPPMEETGAPAAAQPAVSTPGQSAASAA